MERILLIALITLAFPNYLFGANPNYFYQVDVQDPFRGNFQQKGETRVGEKAEGFYSLVEPDGRLRTVTYVSDEGGFRPTVTYSYPQGHKELAPVKKLTGVHNHVESPYHYAAAFGNPVFTVKERRHFYKNPVALLTPDVAQVSTLQNLAVSYSPDYLVHPVPPSAPFPSQVVQAVPPSPPISQLVQPVPQPLPLSQLETVPLSPPIPLHVVQTGPSLFKTVVQAVPPQPPAIQIYAPKVSQAVRTVKRVKVVQPLRLQQVVHAVPPVAQVVVAPAAPPSGYAYPVPDIKLDYPVPPTTPLPPSTYLPPTTEPPPTTPAPPSGGYLHPIPQIKLEYPVPTPVVELRPLPPPPPPVVVAAAPKLQLVQQPLVDLPLGHVVQAVPPAPLQLVQYGTRFPKVPNFVHYAPPPVPQPQVIFQRQPQVVFQPQPQVILKPQPQPQVILQRQPQVVLPPQPQVVLQPQPQVVFQPQPQPQVVLQPQYHHPIPVQRYSLTPASVFHHQVHRQPEYPLVHARPQVTTSSLVTSSAPVANPAVLLHKYDDIVEPVVMRYATVPLTSYLPTEIETKVTPVVARPAPPVIAKSSANPLTFNYGYDNGVSRVSHSYYGSGW